MLTALDLGVVVGVGVVVVVVVVGVVVGDGDVVVVGDVVDDVGVDVPLGAANAYPAIPAMTITATIANTILARFKNTPSIEPEAMLLINVIT